MISRIRIWLDSQCVSSYCLPATVGELDVEGALGVVAVGVFVMAKVCASVFIPYVVRILVWYRLLRRVCGREIDMLSVISS